VLGPARRRPALGDDEWWPEQLGGLPVRDGGQDRHGSVSPALRPLPSCEALEVAREGRRRAPRFARPRRVRSGPSEPGASTGTWRSSKGAGTMQTTSSNLPDRFDLVRGPAPRRKREGAARAALRVDRDHTELSPLSRQPPCPLLSLCGAQVDDTPFGGGAGMVLRVEVVDVRLQGSTRRDSSTCAASGVS